MYLFSFRRGGYFGPEFRFWPFISYILFTGMFKNWLQGFYRLKIVVNVCLSKNRLIG